MKINAKNNNNNYNNKQTEENNLPGKKFKIMTIQI